jgi:hypothetical protein
MHCFAYIIGKAIDEFSLAVFEELAKEGRELQIKRRAEYDETIDKPQVTKKLPDQSPLSSYGLFYRYKLSLIQKAQKNCDNCKQTVVRLISALPGLEDYSSVATAMTAMHVKELRRAEIRLALLHNLSPNDVTADNRSPCNSMSVMEMSKLMVKSWESIDDYGRSLFEELAKEARKMSGADQEEKRASPTKKMKMSPDRTQPKKPPPTVWSSNLHPYSVISSSSGFMGQELMPRPPLYPPPTAPAARNTSLDLSFLDCEDALFPDITFKDEEASSLSTECYSDVSGDSSSSIISTLCHSSDADTADFLLPLPYSNMIEEEDGFKKLIATTLEL